MHLYAEGPIILYLIEKYGLSLPIYMKNSTGNGKTYCNIFAYDLLDSRFGPGYPISVRTDTNHDIVNVMGAALHFYDYDICCMLRDGILNNLLRTPVAVAYDNIIKNVNTDKLWLLRPSVAQHCANQGTPVLVISKKYNHMAVVAPKISFDAGIHIYLRYSPHLGCYTANAGEHNDFMFMSDSRGFGAFDWENPEIKYVLFNTYL